MKLLPSADHYQIFYGDGPFNQWMCSCELPTSDPKKARLWAMWRSGLGRCEWIKILCFSDDNKVTNVINVTVCH